MAPVCTNCGSTDFVWAGELKTGGRLSAGQLSLRHGGELPLGTRICRSCGHADLFLRDTRILQAPHEWKPGEFVPIRTQPSSGAPTPPAAPSPPAPTPTPSMAPPPPPPPPAPPAPSMAGSDGAPPSSSPSSDPSPDMGATPPMSSEPEPAAASGEATKPKGGARRRSSKSKKAADGAEG